MKISQTTATTYDREHDYASQAGGNSVHAGKSRGTENVRVHSRKRGPWEHTRVFSFKTHGVICTVDHVRLAGCSNGDTFCFGNIKNVL